MARYIDVDKLKKDLKELPEQERIEYMGIYDVINFQPTADVREILYAHYDENGDCSHCDSAMPIKHKRDFIRKREVGYCYYCGAKMDKE